MTAITNHAALAATAGPCETPLASDLQPIITTLRQRHGNSVLAVVFYGSCLRTGELYAGLLDFYVIVDSYRQAHKNPLSALGNAVVPPNVYYLEQADRHERKLGRMRAKYAVLSITQLEHGAARWFQTGVWGRFAQPLAIVYAKDSESRDRVRAACGQAVLTLLTRALPALEPGLNANKAFGGALALSYGSELRVEGKTRGADIIAENADEFVRRWQLVLPLLPYTYCETEHDKIQFDIATHKRRMARICWRLRSAHGKCLSVLRLVKACFTFRGAVDYAAWKLERHTGEEITVTPRLRRYPLVFAWPLLWRLYRRGVLR